MYTALPKRLTMVFLISFLLIGCSVRLIAPYDPVTDQRISDLQQETMIKLIEWKRSMPAFEDEQSFYDKSETILDILILRNESIPKSELIVQMLQKIKENIILIKDLHQQKLLDNEVIEQVQPDLMAQFNAVQKFQLALKRAEETKK